jgi:two-component system, LytTR family, sensor histidine kinase AlgZ
MSIKQPPIRSSQVTPTPTPARAQLLARLPNFCNLGTMLRVVVIVNVFCLAAALVRVDKGNGLWTQFLLISAIAQPAIMVSLLVNCALRRLFAKLTYWPSVLLLVAVQAGVGFAFWWWLETLTPLDSNVTWWQFAALFAFIVGVMLVYFDLRSRALSPALTEARLQALQARIRPHFLFNSLNAVLSLIRTEPRRAERMLEDMSELFRVLMADNRKLTPLADEIELCQRYLEIEQIRLGDRLRVKWNIDSTPTNALVPPLILQPLIENAVYHGIEPLNVPGELVIDVTARAKQVEIRLANPYRASSTHVSGNRMAIANIKERLQLHFDAEASLRTDIASDRYTVTITMPNVSKDFETS